MIGYLEGKLLKIEENRIILLANQVGYEILLPAIVRASIDSKKVGEEVALHIYHHQTERQPKPTLIGFNREVEREFFRYFISVEDIGPMKAVQALTVPVRQIARAIESRDAAYLKRLKLPPGLTLSTPPFLEGDGLKVGFTFTNEKELKSMVKKLSEIHDDDVLKAILRML